jgi:hypothetical protein
LQKALQQFTLVRGQQHTPKYTKKKRSMDPQGRGEKIMLTQAGQQGVLAVADPLSPLAARSKNDINGGIMI